MPILARHVARAAPAAAVTSRPPAPPVDLLAAMQFLALEIAGASMFSLESSVTAPNCAADHRLCPRLGRPNLLDFLLPPSIPSPRDVLRWGFRRRWLRLIRRIIAARRAEVWPAPRATCST